MGDVVDGHEEIDGREGGMRRVKGLRWKLDQRERRLFGCWNFTSFQHLRSYQDAYRAHLWGLYSAAPLGSHGPISNSVSLF